MRASVTRPGPRFTPSAISAIVPIVPDAAASTRREAQPEGFQAERAELGAVLASEAFQRAPTLGLVLTYICEKYFQGASELIKEYNIAVEALGRGQDFDQKRDSIVRVEAHRLRKRLKEYYESEGKHHAIRIELPLGTYVPVFRRTELAAGTGGFTGETRQEPAAAPASGVAALERAPRPGRLRRNLWLALSAACLLAAGSGALFLWQRAPAGASKAAANRPSQPVDLAAAAIVGEIRISAGSAESVRDGDGLVWYSDRYFEGGKAAGDPKLDVAGTLTPGLFRTWREGEFRYRIPLKAGTYELTLWFAEPALRSGADNVRTFRIWMNGKVAVEEFDIMTEAGAGQVAVAKIWKDITPAEDGFLHLAFTPLGGTPLLSGLSIVPGTPGRLRPIRIAAREEPYTDSSGYLWSADRFFFGGKLVKRREAIQGTSDPELYRGERYGRLTYTIPVPPDSTYTAVLHFAETWFGSQGGGGGAGSRVFDILCNGVLLEREFDVYREAGGAFRAVRKTYRGLKPTPNGKLVLQLVPGRNYAFLNALEILDEGRRPAAQRPQK